MTGLSRAFFSAAALALFAGILALLAAAPAAAQDVHLYKAGRIWTGTGPVVTNGALLVRDGKVVAAGKLQNGSVVSSQSGSGAKAAKCRFRRTRMSMSSEPALSFLVW